MPGHWGRSSRSYGPPGSSSRRSAPTHQPRSRPTPVTTAVAPPSVLSKPTPTYQNVHQTGAVTQTPGRTVIDPRPGGGDPGMTYTRPPVIPSRKDVWNVGMPSNTYNPGVSAQRNRLFNIRRKQRENYNEKELKRKELVDEWFETPSQWQATGRYDTGFGDTDVGKFSLADMGIATPGIAGTDDMQFADISFPKGKWDYETYKEFAETPDAIMPSLKTKLEEEGVTTDQQKKDFFETFGPVIEQRSRISGRPATITTNEIIDAGLIKAPPKKTILERIFGAEGGIANPRLMPHTGSDLLAKKNSEGTRSKYQPPGGGATSLGSGRDYSPGPSDRGPRDDPDRHGHTPVQNVHQTGAVTQTPGRPTYQNVHQTGAVTQTPGRPPTVTTGGGPPSVLNPPSVQPFNYAKFRKGTATSPNTLWNRWKQHALMTEIVMKGRKVKDYHQLGAYDFMQRFNINPNVAKGLATAYQYASELGRQFIPVNQNNIYTALGADLRKDKPFEPLGAIVGSISDALSRAKEESRLGHLGIEGLTESQQAVYDQLAEEVNPSLRKMVMANGGIVDLYRHGGFSG